MKTLKEVITVLDGCFLKSRKEWCIENCPYLQNDEQMCRRDVLNDALHYLKEYQTTQMSYIKATADLEDNPPLTWEELRTMTGKPVWIEQEITKKWYRGWVIVKAAADNAIITEPRLFYADGYGKTWLAYRKERDGADS